MFKTGLFFLKYLLVTLFVMGCQGMARADGSLEYVSGKLASPSVKPDSSVVLEVEHQIKAPVSGAPEIFCVLFWKGEEVSRVTRPTASPMSSWVPGQSQRERFELPVPFCAPQGEYEIRTGFVDAPYANGESSVQVAKLQIGQAERAEPVRAEVKQLVFPGTVAGRSPLNASAQVVLNRRIAFDAFVFLAFWKDGILWGVWETGLQAPTSQWLPGQESRIELALKEAGSLPAGEYEVRLGLHRIATSQQAVVKTNLSRGTWPGPRAYKPLSHGIYTDHRRGEAHFWHVNQQQALIWDGKPYIPVGGMIGSAFTFNYKTGEDAKNKEFWQQDLKAYELFKREGVKDVYINPVKGSSTTPTWVWQFYFDYLEDQGFHYSMQANRHLVELGYRNMEICYPRAWDGVSPFKLGDIKKSGKVSLAISDSIAKKAQRAVPLSARFITVNPETQEAVQHGEGKAEAGEGKWMLNADVQIPSAGDYTVYFTPRVRITGDHMPNYWDHWEEYRNSFENFASKLELGPGFRFWVDPIMNESQSLEGIRILSPRFDALFARWLQDKYGSLERLNAAWQASPPLESFEDAAALVPLYTADKNSGKERITYYAHQQTNLLYTLDASRGMAWDDYVDCQLQAYSDFNNMVADALKKHIDAPVVFKHVSHTSPLFINRKLKGGFDGVGSEDYGNFHRMRLLEGYHYSAAAHFTKTAWLFVTETSTEEDGRKKVESKEFGYPSKKYMHEHFDLLIKGGAKGIFDFLLGGGSSYKSDQPFDVAYSYVRNPKMFPWLKEYREKINSEDSLSRLAGSVADPEVYFYYSEYAGNVWWLKANSRTAVLPNDDITSIKMTLTDDDHVVAPCYDPWVDTRVLFVNLENAPATASLGPAFEKLLAERPAGKRIVYVGLRKNVGALPGLDGYFTGKFGQSSENDTVQILKPTPTSKVLASTKDGKPWALRDGELWIIANNSFVETSDHRSILRFVKEFKISQFETPTVSR